MKSLESAGLTVEQTGVETNRELHTISHKGAYVAGICYSSKIDRFGVEKAGVWSDICRRPELTKSQLTTIRSYIKRETKRFDHKIFGGQK